jgi:hypothetical protein
LAGRHLAFDLPVELGERKDGQTLDLPRRMLISAPGLASYQMPMAAPSFTSVGSTTAR